MGRGSRVATPSGLRPCYWTRPRWPRTSDKEEDHILSSSVARYGSKRGPATESRWSEISRRLPGRTNKDCRKRWFHSLDPTLRKGRWTEGEDRTLMETYDRIGPCWKEIAALIPGRTDDQCSKRYTAILDPSVKDRLADWTPEEDRFLIANVSRIGHKWAMMSAALPGRPPLTCRNRYRALKAHGKNAERCMDNTSNPPSSASSTIDARDGSQTVTDADNQTVCDRTEEIILALPDTEETSLPDTFDQYQSPQYECLQHTMPDWTSLNMGFSPPSDQHLDIWDDVSMDHMLNSGVHIGLEDLDFDLRSDLSGADSITGSQVFDGNIHLGSSGQHFSGFGAHAIDPQFDNKELFWDTTDGQSGISQAGLGAGNQQSSSGPQHVLHVVHHHHVYHITLTTQAPRGSI